MQPQSSLFRRPAPASGQVSSEPYASASPSASPAAMPSSSYTTYNPVSTTPTPSYGQSSLNYRGGAGAADGVPAGPRSITQTQEEENDALIKALLHDVRRAKTKFTGLGDEVKKQNTFLEQLEGHFRGARTALGKTIRRLDAASGSSGFRHMWILFLFVIVFFMFIYLLLKFRR